MKPYDLHVKLDLDSDQLVNMIKLVIEKFSLKTTIYKSHFRNVKNFLSNPTHFLILLCQKFQEGFLGIVGWFLIWITYFQLDTV